MKHKIIISFIVLAGAVSCEKLLPAPEHLQRSPQPILFCPDGTATKAFIDSTVLPDTYTIYLSAYLNDDENPANTGNYFTSVPYKFSKEKDDVRIWTGTPTQYWPMSGSLGFLGIATDIDDISFQWADIRNTDGVTVTVPEDYDGTGEVLYGVTERYSRDIVNVPITFQHTQALLEFNFKSECESIIRLVDIQIKEAYTGGRLHVSNYPVVYAKWDTDDVDVSDIKVTSVFPETPLDAGYDKTYSIAVVPKLGQHFVVNFRQRANLSSPWASKSVLIPFDYSRPELKWKAGTKYTYNFVLDPEEITCTVVTTDVDFGDGTVIYVNEESDFD